MTQVYQIDMCTSFYYHDIGCWEFCCFLVVISKAVIVCQWMWQFPTYQVNSWVTFSVTQLHNVKSSSHFLTRTHCHTFLGAKTSKGCIEKGLVSVSFKHTEFLTKMCTHWSLTSWMLIFPHKTSTKHILKSFHCYKVLVCLCSTNALSVR